MSRDVFIIGAGMTRFRKPSEGASYTTLAAEAVQAAVKDASSVTYDMIEQAFASYVYGDSCSGQRALYEVGMTGVPIFNVNNNCASGSTGIFLARQVVRSGAADCVLVVGFEQMAPGALSSIYKDRPDPLEPYLSHMGGIQGRTDAPIAAQLFGGGGRSHMETYGTRAETFARIAVKARRHAAENPYAVFRDPVTVEEVMASPPVFDPLTRLQCCPPTCGAAAVVLASRDFARRLGVDAAVRVRAQGMSTDTRRTFDAGSMLSIIGYDMAKAAAAKTYEEAEAGPEDVDVVELHDCFTTNEFVSYEALGLAREGGAERMVLDGDNTYGGRYVVNPSGGLLSKGHPLGATGVAQAVELYWQLTRRAGRRQVEGARMGLQHNLGLGGACVVTLYEAMEQP